MRAAARAARARHRRCAADDFPAVAQIAVAAVELRHAAPGARRLDHRQAGDVPPDAELSARTGEVANALCGIIVESDLRLDAVKTWHSDRDRRIERAVVRQDRLPRCRAARRAAAD